MRFGEMGGWCFLSEKNRGGVFFEWKKERHFEEKYETFRIRKNQQILHKLANFETISKSHKKNKFENVKIFLKSPNFN
jgi:hypothetical protein